MGVVCLTWSSVPRAATQEIRGYPLSTFKFLDSGVTMSYYKAQYLVDIDSVSGRRVLKLEDHRKSTGNVTLQLQLRLASTSASRDGGGGGGGGLGG
ncbi:hypothetical protein QVD17_21099 [Tagetes erecta]|uniref:Uncharacterized protein n=1 Tax=Tagetes erecta TaxID=13708 RepID=A0AAD8KMG4_TARER|nr:hypothetical protein QVD17_21099 [Tagetes erecta]